MLYSYKNQYPSELPERIRLSSGLTRTGSSTFTEEELTDAGYVAVENAPSYNSNIEKVIWNGTVWEIIALTEEEISEKQVELWKKIREKRNTKIKEIEWKIFRYQSEVRLGLTPTDDIQKLDTYIQALRDITFTTTNPLEVSWPSLNL